MVTVLQTTFSNTFYPMKIMEFWLKFHWSLFLMIKKKNKKKQTKQNKTKQGKSEGFDSCDRPSNLTQIGFKFFDFSARVTLKFDGWPQKTKGHLIYATLSFVHHFVPIGEFKLELQSGNAQFGSKSTLFWAMWPWNFKDDLQKQQGTYSMLLQALCIIS